MRALLVAVSSALVGCALLTDFDELAGGEQGPRAGDASLFDIETTADAAPGDGDAGLDAPGERPHVRGTTIATAQGLPTRIAVDPAGLFFVDSSPATGGVRYISADAGVIESYSGPLDVPVGLQVDSDVVRWILANGTLMLRNRAQTTPNTFASVNDVSTSFAYDGPADRWVATSPNDGKLRYCVFGTCGDEVTGRTQPREIVSRNAYFYWLETDLGTGSKLLSCTVHGNSCPSSVDVKMTDLGTARGFAVDTTEAYVASDDKIVDVTIATKTRRDLATGLAKPQAVYVYGAVFFTTLDDGKVWKLPASGPPILVGEDLVQPVALAVDATGVYVVSNGDGRIVRFALP